MSKLSEAVKAKYPQYANIPDDQLDKMIVAKYPQYQKFSNIKTWGGFGKNVVESAIGAAKGIIQPLTQPVQTVKDLGNLAIGAAQLVIPGKQDKEKFAKALGQFYVDRYGSLEKARDTIYSDPVGVVADISTVIGGGAGILKAGGQATKIGGLTRAGQRLGALTPETLAMKGLSAVAPKGVMAKAGAKLEQFGKEYALRGIRVSQPSINKFNEKFRTPMEDWVAKQGLTVDQLEELRNSAIPTSQTEVLKPLYSARKAVILKEGRTIPARQVYYSIIDKINELKTGAKGDVPANVQLAQDLENYLNDFIQRRQQANQKDISLSYLDDLRSQFDIKTKDSEFMKSSDTSFNRIMGDIFRNIVNEKAGTTDVGQKISQYETFAEIARKSPSGKGNIPLGLGTGVWMQGLENVWLVGPAAGAVVREFINAPRTVQKASQATQKIGKAMQGMGEKAAPAANVFRNTLKAGLGVGKAARMVTPEGLTMEEPEKMQEVKRVDPIDRLLQFEPVQPKAPPQTKIPTTTTTNAFSKVKKLRKGAFV